MKQTLERILNSIKEQGNEILAKGLKYGRNVLASGLMIGALVGSANANPGDLKIKNNLNSHPRQVSLYRDDNAYPGATDGYDIGMDGITNLQPSGYPDIYSDITTHTLWSDFRPEDSNAPYNIKLSFSGSLPSTQPNWLEFSFPWDSESFPYDFGNQPVLFQSDRLPYGPVIDVRRAIAQNGGIVDLIEAVAGTSGVYEPNATLDINSRILGDLDDSGIVNFVDYSILAQDWQKPQGQYVGDIAGPNGIPDGFVNNYDLSAFSDDWLRDVNDL